MPTTSVSLPTDLIEWVADRARHNGTNKSSEIADVLRQQRDREWMTAHVEGAKQHREFIDEIARLHGKTA